MIVDWKNRRLVGARTWFLFRCSTNGIQWAQDGKSGLQIVCKELSWTCSAAGTDRYSTSSSRIHEDLGDKYWVLVESLNLSPFPPFYTWCTAFNSLSFSSSSENGPSLCQWWSQGGALSRWRTEGHPQQRGTFHLVTSGPRMKIKDEKWKRNEREMKETIRDY